jgi:hypothetical protein
MVTRRKPKTTTAADASLAVEQKEVANTEVSVVEEVKVEAPVQEVEVVEAVTVKPAEEPKRVIVSRRVWPD